MSQRKEKEQSKYDDNWQSGGNAGAGKSGREDMGSEKSDDTLGSHKPNTATRRDANEGAKERGDQDR
jgi:hypothetical protein